MQTFEVFLSSTFEDMDMVRTSIQSTALPELQEYFLLNEASCNLIDLRWGVSKKEELERRVLKRCLQDIENCAKTPFFFVGIIGERYGWSPCRQDIGNAEDKYVDILNLAVNSSWSVTELECQFAERIKGNSKTAYFISSSYNEAKDERISTLVKYVVSRGDYIIEYEFKSEIPSKFLELMLTLMADNLNVVREKLDLLTSIERRVETITRKIKLKDLKSTIKNYLLYRMNSCHRKISYSTPEGLTYDRESIIAIELLAIEILLKVKPLKALKLLEQRRGLSILRYTIRDLLGFKNNHLGNCIFALLAFCTPDGLTRRELIAILESTGFHSDSIESSIELLLPFFLIREGKFKLIHPILGSGHTIGLFEKCSPAVNSLVNHYLSDESYEGDEHVIYAWTEQIKAEFYWTMGGTSRAELLISSALDRIESASEITMLYDRRRHLFYAFMMYACAVNFDQYRKFCHRVESIVKEHSHLAVFRIMLEDDRILSDFPLLVFCISKALKYSETQRDALLLKQKKYRIICGAILRELKGSWRPNVRFERVDFIDRAIIDANYKLESGSLLYSLVTLYEQAYNSGKVPYSFKMFSFLVERRGLEYINNT